MPTAAAMLGAEKRRDATMRAAKLIAVLALAAQLLPGPASAADYPSRPSGVVS